jgi:uncharacterized protein YmfQ (DUF2313 family)
MADLFVRRSAVDYAEAFDNLHPVGPAWPRAESPAPDDATPRGDDEALSDLTRGLAQVWGDKVDARAADLLFIETDPRYTSDLLSDWENAFGLPDPCVQRPQTLEERRLALVTKLTTEGGQSRAFFIALAVALGYAITITEYSPFMAGLSRAGDPNWSVGSPGIRFYWTITVTGPRLSWFRGGQGHAGIDPLCRISRADDLECRLRRFKPAHTELIFNYTGV